MTAAGEEAPAEEGPGMLGQAVGTAHATVVNVVYPDDVVEGSPAWVPVLLPGLCLISTLGSMRRMRRPQPQRQHE